MPEFTDSSSTATLSTSADSSAADTSTSGAETSTASPAKSQNTGAPTGASGWGAILNSGTSERDTQAEGADVAKDGATTETEAATEGQEAATADDNRTSAEEQVPWHKDPRWVAFQAERALLDQAKPLIEPLLQQYGGVEGINAELQRQAQEEQTRQQREIERQDQAAVEQRLQAKLQTGELDESAYQQALQYEVGLARLYRVEMNGAVQTAATEFPDMDRDLVQAFAADPDMVRVIAQHTHGRVAELKTQHTREIEALRNEMKTAGERAVAEYVAANKDRLRQPAPEGGSGSGPGGPIDRNNLGGWGSILGGRGRKA